MTTMKAGGGGPSSSSRQPGPAGRVAIVGGGIAGLACAKELLGLGLPPVVFDTGVHAPGGRCSSRALIVDGTDTKKQRLLLDHAAQFVSVPADREAAMASADAGTRRWLEWVGDMEAKGVLREWDGTRIGTLQRGGRFTPRESKERAMVGAGGIRAIPQYLAEGIQQDRPKWVSKVKPLADGKGWRLWHYQELIGVRSVFFGTIANTNNNTSNQSNPSHHNATQDFSHLVVAHNGKCAARLSKSGGDAVAPVQRLLEVKFGSTLRSDPPRQMQLCSLFALLVVLDHPLPLSAEFEGAFVEGVPELSWVANNGPKLHIPGYTDAGQRSAWTLISSPQFAERNKVPQENIPKEKEEEVSGRLLRAFERALGLAPNSVRPAARHLQLWGAANPISVTTLPPETPFIFQPATRTGVCGDWLSAPSIPAAAASGVMLARRIASHVQAEARVRKGEVLDDGLRAAMEEDVGLDCGFRAVSGARPIAAFAGDEAAAAAAAAAVAAGSAGAGGPSQGQRPRPSQQGQGQGQGQRQGYKPQPQQQLSGGGHGQGQGQQQQQQRRRRPAHHRFNSTNGDADTRPVGGGGGGAPGAGANRPRPPPPPQAAPSK